MDASIPSRFQLRTLPVIAGEPLAFPVVGIGASAGGLDALKAFLEYLPDLPGAAWVVVMHLTPNQPSDLGPILRQYTKLPVIVADKAVWVTPDRIYLAPPGQTLALVAGCLVPQPLPPRVGCPVAIDIFFRSLAQTQRERAIAIVLSGMLTDGAAGLAYVKAQGGVAVAQLPSEARERSMPQAAIDTGGVDFVLPVAEMPQRLREWAGNGPARPSTAGGPERSAPASPSFDPERTADADPLQAVLAVLLAGTGHDFRPYKPEALVAGIERRMQVRATPEMAGYRALLQHDAVEQGALLKEFFIGITEFFRDPEVSRVLETRVLPELFRHAAPRVGVRVWVAACSTGEEAYSIAMLMEDLAARWPEALPMQLFATDINGPAIDAGRAGCYPASIENAMSQERLHRYFVANRQGYRVRRRLRDMVTFGVHDLLRSPPMPELDLISCRNFLIYLTPEMQWRVLERLHQALRPGGYLLLGNTESADALPDLFSLVDQKNRIYQAKACARTGHPVSCLAGNAATHTATMTAKENTMASPAKFPRSNDQSSQARLEDLECKNEQLQSIIEELRTVNNELSCRVNETARANDDLNNLIDAVDLPTLFVDREMHLLRYTPRTTELFNFIAVDIGRPLADITHRLDYPDMLDDIAGTLAAQQLREREVRSRSGRTYLVRLLPYRTAHERIDGVVLTFFDVSLQRDAEAQQTFLLNLSDTLRPWADPDTIQQAASRLLREHFGLERVVFWAVTGDDVLVPGGGAYAPGTPQSSLSVRLADFGPDIAAALQAGEVVVRDETTDDQALAGGLGGLGGLHPIDSLNRWIGVPRVIEGRLAGLLTAAYARPHRWSPVQVALVREVAERTQIGLERARAEMALAELNDQLKTQLQQRTTALQASEERVRGLTSGPEK